MRVKFFRILSHPLAMSVSGVRRLPASLGASFADTARANVCSLSSLWTSCKQVTKGAAVCSSLHQGGKYTPNITKQYTGIYRKSLNSRAGLEECWTSQAGSCCARRMSTSVCKCHADPSSISLHLLPFFVPNFWCNIFDTAICTDSQHKFRLHKRSWKIYGRHAANCREVLHAFTAWRFRVPKISDIDSRQMSTG
jgi:hypothetical protein